MSPETGGTQQSAIDEAHRIWEIIEPYFEQLTLREQAFVDKMNNATYCSPKQLFWLRDIKEKYAE